MSSINESLWPEDIWAMQMKYVAIALNAADATFRIPADQKFYASVVSEHKIPLFLLQFFGGIYLNSLWNMLMVPVISFFKSPSKFCLSEEELADIDY
ncbi:hypothetical protein I5L01_15335 [Erythrobacter sp. YJ-T3-07]|nr:hypothetical protein [Erythrobacter sp. YJ-T3-07]